MNNGFAAVIPFKLLGSLYPCLLLFIAVFFLSTAAEAQAQKGKIVVMIEPLKMLLVELGIPKENIVCLLSGSENIHTFEFTPRLRRFIDGASLILTASGIEINSSLLQNKDFKKKLFSIGDPNDTKVHGWLSPKILLSSLQSLHENVPDITETSLKTLEGNIKNIVETTKQTILNQALKSPCEYIGDHAFVDEFASEIGCVSLKTLKVNEEDEITLRTVISLRDIKKKHPQIFFIAGAESNAHASDLFENELKIPVRIIYENGHHEISFTEFFSHLGDVFTTANVTKTR